MITKKEILKQRNENTNQKNLAESLKRLYSNPDFKEVFENYYCNAYAISLVNGLALYSEDTIKHKETLKELNAISNFKKFLNKTIEQGAMAIESLKELEVIPESEIEYE